MAIKMDILETRAVRNGVTVLFRPAGKNAESYSATAKSRADWHIRAAIKAYEKKRHKAGVACWCGRKAKGTRNQKALKV